MANYICRLNNLATRYGHYRIDFGFSFVLIYLAGFDGKFFGGAFAIAGFLGFIAARMSPYRWERIQSWFDPWPHAQDMGYQTVQGLLAVGSGGILGEGFMQGTSKYFYLPEAHTDFCSFAVWVQEMGFVGAVFVVVLIAALPILGSAFLIRLVMNSGNG